MILRIPRRLDSPNASRGAHWRVRHRITEEWEQEIWAAVAQNTNAREAVAALPELKRRPESIGRMRVVVERHVPSMRNFIRDADNLAFCVKPVNDALKRLAYIRDDSQKWLEQPMPTQHVSDDGKDWTVITIEPAV